MAPQLTNRLSDARSLYLLQHASNPVHWQEWGDEALALAKQSERPILASFGYSSCHWCHVMAHESFENQEVADFMNANFINIKVDREERPDVDRIYMTYLTATSGRGGWPLTVFLTPELHPFFAGTYFPRPRFLNLLTQLDRAWRTKPDQIRATGQNAVMQIGNALASRGTSESVAGLDLSSLARTMYSHWISSFDTTFAGFGDAPKVPFSLTFHPLHRHAYYTKDMQERQMAAATCSITLRNIAKGGITDQVGKGVSRYSVDDHWHIPHFEKMLYDQAQLLSSALEAALLVPANKPEVREELQAFASDILTYVERDLTHKDGGFYSAEDADSFDAESGKNREGAVYVWRETELRQILGDDFGLFAYRFGVEREGNVPSEVDQHDELKGKNHLFIKTSIEETASHAAISAEDAKQRLETSLTKLFDYRNKNRARPSLDDKVIAAWNGMMISALAAAAEHPWSPSLREHSLDLALRAVSFIKAEMYHDGELCRSWRKGRGPRGQSEDYALLAHGLLDLYEASGDEEHLLFALELQQKQDELFLDRDDGGYFCSPAVDTSLVLRLKDSQDGAEPTAASVTVSNLYRLADLFPAQHATFTAQAKGTVASVSDTLKRAPFAFGTLLSSARLDEEDQGIKQLIVTGARDDPKTQEMLAAIRRRFIPNRVLVRIDPASPPRRLAEQNEAIAALLPETEPAVRVCEGGQCSLPLMDLAAVEERLTSWSVVNR